MDKLLSDSAAVRGHARPVERVSLARLLGERIVVLDGATGTLIQRKKLDESVYRGDRFKDHGRDLKGNSDILNLTQPDIVLDLHRAYLAAGADIVQTNTFNATTISQNDYATQSWVGEINRAGASLARRAVDEAMRADPLRPRFVAGILGPTNRTASISPDVNDPAARNITFDQLALAYAESAQALIEGGADLIMIETVFDTLNAKAAIYAILDLEERLGIEIPLMISGTITDAAGRTLSGQTPEAFWYSIAHASPLAVGFNCALGAHALRPHLQALARIAPIPVSVHPNAGLPNAFGEYDDSPETMAKAIRAFAEEGLVNVVGGCCGTTPEYIAEIAAAVRNLPPRDVCRPEPVCRLPGPEGLKVEGATRFFNIT